MRASRVHLFVAPLCLALLAGCANESLAGLQLSERKFTGSYLAPTAALTAGIRATSALPTAAPSEVFSEEEIKALANKTLQITDEWVGPICEKYKAYNVFFNKHIDFNEGDEGLTTGGEFTGQAFKLVQGMKPLAKNKEQKDFVAYAEKLYKSIMAGSPVEWSGGYPVDERDDWFKVWTAEWTTAKGYDVEANQPAVELAAYQAAMAACLKLK